jgi:hypothetical protein
LQRVMISIGSEERVTFKEYLDEAKRNLQSAEDLLTPFGTKEERLEIAVILEKIQKLAAKHGVKNV